MMTGVLLLSLIHIYITANTHITPVFVLKSYIVTWNPNGGTVDPTSTTKTHGSTLGTLPTCLLYTSVSVKVVDLFDSGSRAEMDRKNGRMYGGFPVTSYTMVFLDHSVDNTSGEPNIQLVCEEGREYLYGIYQGITPLPKMCIRDRDVHNNIDNGVGGGIDMID